jgi:hypothetical protein
MQLVLLLLLFTEVAHCSGDFPFALRADFSKTSSIVDARTDESSSFLFCRTAGSTVRLPAPSDSTYVTISKGRHGDYHRSFRILAVGGECTITTESGLISAPGISAASITTTEVCGFSISGQTLSLISDGSNYFVYASHWCALRL